MLGAAGDERAVPFIKNYFLKQATLANEGKRPPVGSSDATLYGRAIGMLVYRKVRSADELLAEVSKPEFWNVGAFPQNMTARDASIALCVNNAYITAGYKDSQVTLERTRQLIAPDKQIRVFADGDTCTWKEMVTNSAASKGMFQNLGQTSDIAKLTDEYRETYAKDFEELPVSIREAAIDFHAKKQLEAEKIQRK